jgi:hypothetical protein
LPAGVQQPCAICRAKTAASWATVWYGGVAKPLREMTRFVAAMTDPRAALQHTKVALRATLARQRTVSDGRTIGLAGPAMNLRLAIGLNE